MSKGLDFYIAALTDTFKKNEPRIAHASSKNLLLEMAQDKTILLEIIKRNITSKDFFLKKRINPVIALTIVDNPYITLVSHFWMPLPNRATNVTHQSIHHHGRLLLTSVAPYGPGYESIIFKKGFQIDPVTEHTHIEIEKEYKNPLYNLEYIETNTPHVVFYPKDLSVTYALWTYDQRSTLDKIRKLPFLQKNKKRIIQFLNFIKGSKNAINKIEYLDFYPIGKSILAMKERVMYPVGTNENFIHNVFYILQHVGYTDFESVKKILSSYPESIQKQCLELMQQIENKQEIQDRFDPIHMNIEKINFSREAFEIGINK